MDQSLASFLDVSSNIRIYEMPVQDARPGASQGSSTTSKTNSTCKLTVLPVEPHGIPANKRMGIIPCYFLTELHHVRFYFVVTKLIPTITWLTMPKFHFIIYYP
jgi:hypothetical protein